MKALFDDLETCLGEKFPRPESLFRILILFENESVSDRAKHLHDGLFQHMKDHCHLETYRWDLEPFDGLTRLVKAITRADMIIVAGHERSELAKKIKTALRIGLAARRVKGGALVAFLGRTNIREQNPSALHLFLQQVAQEFDLNFFPGAFQLPQENLGCDFESIHQRAEKMTPTLDRILHRIISPVGYGINE